MWLDYGLHITFVLNVMQFPYNNKHFFFYFIKGRAGVLTKCKITKYETCAILQEFHILNIFRKCNSKI